MDFILSLKSSVSSLKRKAGFKQLVGLFRKHITTVQHLLAPEAYSLASQERVYVVAAQIATQFAP